MILKAFQAGVFESQVALEERLTLRNSLVLTTHYSPFEETVL